MPNLKKAVDFLNELQPDRSVCYGIERFNGGKVTKWIKSEVTVLSLEVVKEELRSLYMSRIIAEREVVMLLSDWDISDPVIKDELLESIEELAEVT